MAEDNKPVQQPQPQRLPQNPPGQAPQGGHSDPSRRAVEDANRTRRASFDQEKKAVAERPQQVGNEGQKPTPTQQENDEISNGLRHIDDKEDDGSGPDLRFVRRLEADEGDDAARRRKYETR